MHKNVHRPGIEHGLPSWQASILPLNHRCFVRTYLDVTEQMSKSV